MSPSPIAERPCGRGTWVEAVYSFVSMTRILWLLVTFKTVKIHKILESPLIPNQLGRINKNDTKKSRKNISVKYHVAIYVSFMF